jgi:DNA-binding IscR family transcriptional regulator
LALQRARLVETRKGAGSGSRLSRAPGRINLAEVFRAVEEEPPFTMPRCKPNPECPVGQCIQASLDKVFTSAQEALERQLSHTTLGHILADCARTRSGSPQP